VSAVEIIVGDDRDGALHSGKAIIQSRLKKKKQKTGAISHAAACMDGLKRRRLAADPPQKTNAKRNPRKTIINADALHANTNLTKNVIFLFILTSTSFHSCNDTRANG
jgi:hypothetical protein